MALSSLALGSQVDVYARADAQEIGPAAPILLNIWIYFNLFPNVVGLSILVLTFLFAKSVKRHPTLINVCISWILSGVFSLLLFFTGHVVGPEPPKALCITQTTLLYGMTPMWTTAIFMLVAYMLMAFSRKSVKRGMLYLMLIAPYVAQLGFSLACLFISLQHPEQVTRDRRYFYCALESGPLSNTMAIFTFSVCVVILVLEVLLARTLHRNWTAIHKAGRSSGIDLQVILRVLVFGVYVLLGMIVSMLTVFDGESVFPDMYGATVGLVVLLIFGSQTDVIRAWCFWRPPRSSADSFTESHTSQQPLHEKGGSVKPRPELV